MNLRTVLKAVLILGGLILILDEIWMFGVPIGSPGWLIGDWSWMHVDPFHHWMLGVVMVALGVFRL